MIIGSVTIIPRSVVSIFGVISFALLTEVCHTALLQYQQVRLRAALYFCLIITALRIDSVDTEFIQVFPFYRRTRKEMMEHCMTLMILSEYLR